MKLIRFISAAMLAIAVLAISVPILPAQALTYAEISGQGKILGDSTTFYPYPTGTLVNDSGTIYFISGTTKVPFTNWQAFVGLGFSIKNVVEGDLTNYTPSQSYTIHTANATHPWGSWLIYRGTVYYSSQDGLIGVPSASVFTSNGGDWQYIVKANSYDITTLNSNPNLPVLSVNDSRVTTTPTYASNNANPSLNSSNNSGTNISSSSLTITPTTLPSATIGQSYSTQISVSGGTAPYTWTTISTTYPSSCCALGLNGSGNTSPSYSSSVTFNTQSSATVINTYPAGTYYWTIQVKDAVGNTTTQTLGLTINQANSNAASLSITTTSLPAATVGQAYGGTVAFTYTGNSTVNISVSGLPPGMQAPTSIGNIGSVGGSVVDFRGAPTTPGIYPITVSLNDNTGATASYNYSLVVNSASTQNSTGDVPSAPVLATSGTSTAQQLLMVSRSPNGDNIFYTIDWGDNSTKGYYSAQSGQIIAESHNYVGVGTYTVTVSAATQNSSEISSTLQVIVSPVTTTNNSGAAVSPTIVNITVDQGANSSPQPVTISWPGYVPVSGVLTNAVLFGGVSSNSLNWLNISNISTGQGSSILDLPANGTFYVSVNAANLTTGTYSGSISINNITGSVPTVSISIPVNVTVTSPSLNVSLNSAVPSALSVTSGSTNQKVASFQILNNSKSPAVVYSITLNATRNTIGNNFQNLKLMANASPSQIQIGTTQPTVSSNGVYTFTFNTPLIISAGASTIVEAYTDVASGVTNTTSGVANQNLVSLNAITGTWQVNGAAINSITAIVGQTISLPY